LNPVTVSTHEAVQTASRLGHANKLWIEAINRYTIGASNFPRFPDHPTASTQVKKIDALVASGKSSSKPSEASGLAASTNANRKARLPGTKPTAQLSAESMVQELSRVGYKFDLDRCKSTIPHGWQRFLNQAYKTLIEGDENDKRILLERQRSHSNPFLEQTKRA
jgi:hypothetical protein